MLAGADLSSATDSGVMDARPEWSEVIAGKWLTGKLGSLRSPQVRAEIDAGAGLTGELRPYQTGPCHVAINAVVAIVRRFFWRIFCGFGSLGA